VFVTTPRLQAALAKFKVKWEERKARVAALESLIASGEQRAMTEGACGVLVFFFSLLKPDVSILF
jgi:hypothetical protein